MATKVKDLNTFTSPIADVTASLLGKITERHSIGGVDLLGVSTGLKTVDRLTGGMGADELWIVAGSTGVGKSSMALNVSLAVARQGSGVIYYSLEMSAESLVNRLLASMTGIDSGRIIRGKFTTAEMRALKLAAEEISTFDLTIVDSTVTSEDVLEHSLRVADTHGNIGLVTIDYAQLLADANTFGDVERIGRISGNARALARPDYLNVPVLLLSQLNRASHSREDRTPQLHDLKGASDLEQDAHVVLLLHRPYKDSMMQGAPPLDVETDAKIIIAKSRNGQMGATSAQFHTKTTVWTQ